MATIEMANIQNAILAYDNTYGKLPISERISSGRPGDFTFGTSGTGTKRLVGNPAESYQANNSEVLAILMAITSFRDGRPNVNTNHTLNPKRIQFFGAKEVASNQSPGVGLDGVYRDPWGNPYIITLDVNGDGFCEDPLYGRVRQKVFVWSFGPDAKADLSLKPNEGVNQDNIATAH